jgi:hypothetical protein
MKPSIAFVANLTLVTLVSQSSQAVADLPPFPRASSDSAASRTIPLLLAGLAFVLVVSGISFFLLRRMARKRREGTGPSASGSANQPSPQPAPGASRAHDEG